MLTKKQHELLIFLHRHIRGAGVSPSFEEMKAAVNLKSKSGVHRLITALEERGFIKRLPHRARAIEILKLPHEAATFTSDTPVESASTTPSIAASNVVQGEFAAQPPIKDNDNDIVAVSFGFAPEFDSEEGLYFADWRVRFPLGNLQTKLRLCI